MANGEQQEESKKDEIKENPPSGEPSITGGESERDEEIDMATATEIARNYIRDNVGNLILHQFRIEDIRKNGDNTKYIVRCSVVGDLGEEREHFLIRINVYTKKLVPPAGKGKVVDGKLQLSEIDIDPKWTK